MSIVIKGMEMPKSCHECGAEQEGFWCGLLPTYSDTRCFDSERRDDCPLVERRRGTWVPFASHAALGTFVKCSECGKTGDAAWAGCPWCLAVMDKAPEEAERKEKR